ncbi:hypothetical protein PTKIN_Ptkin02bG0079200 [Pterospermum kingtungense]
MEEGPNRWNSSLFEALFIEEDQQLIAGIHLAKKSQTGSLTNDILEKVLYVGWVLWGNRNNCLFNQTCKSASAIAHSSQQMSLDYIKSKVSPASTVVQHAVVWEALPLGFYKLNVDASYSQVILAARKIFTGITGPLHAEIHAVLFGLEIVQQQGLRVQLVESDSLLVVLEINKGVQSRSEWRNIIMDICVLKQLCGVRTFSHSKRAANKLAHSIAKAHGL